MFKNAIDVFANKINEKMESRFKEMLNIYDGFDTLFTPNEVLNFMHKNNLKLKCDKERNDYKYDIRRYFIYDNNMETDTAAFYYEVNKENLTIDISKVYVWPGFDEEYDNYKVSRTNKNTIERSEI